MEGMVYISSKCIKSIHLLFSLVEDRSEPYISARECLERQKNNSNCINELVSFIKTWNKSRRYTDGEARQIVEKIVNNLASLEDAEQIQKEQFKEIIAVIQRDNKYYEFIATIKLLHVLNPEKWPLIDREISRELSLFNDNDSIDYKIERYLKFQECFKEKVFSKYNFEETTHRGIKISPYKTIDEFLFLVFSKEKKNLLKELKYLYEDEELGKCINKLFSLIQKLKQCLEQERKI